MESEKVEVKEGDRKGKVRHLYQFRRGRILIALRRGTEIVETSIKGKRKTGVGSWIIFG